MIANRVCHLLGVKYPIIQGGMMRVSCPELAAAVSNSHGVGILSAVNSIEKIKKDIRRTRELTDKPFGVNIPLFILGDTAQDVAELVAKEGVKLIVTAAGSPEVCTRLLKNLGAIVIHVVACVGHAIKAEAAGVDAVVAEGVEAGGSVGRDEVTTLVLVPQVVDAVKIPVIASGGIGDARGFVASLALGAEGIQMGTRFIATKECPVSPDYKQAIIKAADNSTEIISRGQAPSRRFRPDFLKEIVSNTGVSYSAGEVAGLIRDIPTVAELFDVFVRTANLVNERVKETLSEMSSGAG